jgi:dCTP deaminase
MLSPVSIQPDHWIRARALEGMIKPFADRQVRQEGDAKIISYGLSSFGYDLRAAREWKIFVNAFHTVVDPKEFDPKSFVDFEGDECIIPPNSFVLARSVEYMRIPENVMVVAVGKSSYARCGVVANVTPLEPGWEGHVTLEFSNTTPLPARMYANEGCVQLLFFEGERPDVTYADRKGKYQGQTGVTLPRL